MRTVYAISACGFLLTTAVAYAQTSATQLTSNATTGFMMAVLGVQLLVVLVVAAKVKGIIRGEVDARLREDDTAFGKHRVDPLAHEPMRRQIVQELKGEFDKLNITMSTMEKHHRDEMRNLTELVKPIVEQNRFAMQVMASQMRRGPGREENDEG